MGKRRLEIIGQKFNRLTVIEFSHIDKWRGACWKCLCDCGNETVLQWSALKSGGTKSCGCVQKENLKKLANKRRLPEGVAACNALIIKYKNQAKKRGIEQGLTDEQIIAFHKGNCHYCGSPPSNTCSISTLNGSYTYSGIDRKDNEKGYTIDNVVPCCISCNSAKGIGAYDEFINWIKALK